MINGNRIRQVRKMRRLTQTELARMVATSQHRLSRIESGMTQPSGELILQIAESTGFPVSFFERFTTTPYMPFGTLEFRARKSLAKLDLEQAHAWGEFALDCAWHLSRTAEPPAVSIPALQDSDATEAASLTRSALGLSHSKPIPNLTHAIERAGVWVLALPVSLPGRDAFSTWLVSETQRIPLIVLMAAGAPADRIRRSLAHELGHLVLHWAYRGSIEHLEDEADTFASEFMMPLDAAVELIPSPLRIEALLELKQAWGISVQSLVMRAAEIGRISQRRKQQLFKWMNSNWGLQTEPRPLPMEKPRVFRKMAEAAYGIPPNLDRFASDMAAPRWAIARMLDAHAERKDVRATVISTAEEPRNIIYLRRSPQVR